MVNLYSYFGVLFRMGIHISVLNGRRPTPPHNDSFHLGEWVRFYGWFCSHTNGLIADAYSYAACSIPSHAARRNAFRPLRLARPSALPSAELFPSLWPNALNIAHKGFHAIRLMRLRIYPMR